VKNSLNRNGQLKNTGGSAVGCSLRPWDRGRFLGGIAEASAIAVVLMACGPAPVSLHRGCVPDFTGLLAGVCYPTPNLAGGDNCGICKVANY